MSLTATNFVPLGPIKSVDMRQFVDLFTGVMTDQPVTFRNTLTVGGNQASATAPLKLFGVSGQTGNLIELYPTTASANPTFGFGALGNFAWGPGSPAANDTFLSRIALQNGHVTDTAGLLVDPYLEVVGNIKAGGYAFANNASITGPGASPFLLVINQDLQINRNLIMMASGKIQGEWTSTVANRTMFQSSTVNGVTELVAVPNGTATGCFIEFFNNPVPTNASEALIGLDAATAYLMVTRQGTGALLPLSVNVGGTEQINFAAAGNLIRVMQPMTTTDITMSRIGTPNIAALWFGNTATHYFYWDGSAMSWNGSGFSVPGNPVIASGFTATANGQGLTIVDGNTRFFSQDRNTYFDEYGGSWRWRNTAAGSATVMASDGAGNMQVTGLMVGPFVNVRQAQAQVSGSSNGATNWTNVNNTSVSTMAQPGGVFLIQDTYGAGSCGGTLLFGSSNTYYCGIRGQFTDGSSYGQGRMSFATRANASDAFLTERMNIDAFTGTVNIVSARLAIGGDCTFIRGGANVLASPGLGMASGLYLGLNGFAYGSGGYCLGLPNIASGQGQAVANAWVPYACVDHALEFGLLVEPIADPVGILKTLTPVRYEHMTIQIGDAQPTRDSDGKIESHPTYGMRASQVASVLPELAGEMTVDYSRLVVVLWAACQAMEERITALESAA